MDNIPTLSGVLAATQSLVSAGASLHWLFAFDFVDERGYKRGKSPRTKDWSEQPVLTLDGLRAAYRDRSNIGIRLGEPSKISGYYLHLIDLDIRVPEKAEEARAALLAIWPEALSFPSVISGSRGESRHIYLLTKEPFRKAKLAKSTTHTLVWDDQLKRNVSRNDWEIDLMGTGSQAVIPPSIHPDTGLAYLWERQLDLDLVAMGVGPIVPVETVSAWGARIVEAAADEDDLETLFNNSPLDLSDEEIDEILSFIPNDAEEIDAAGNVVRTGAHYDDYIEVGMALHHQFQGSEEGFDRWVEWGSQSSKFDEAHARYRWDKSFGDAKNPVRMATLIQKANTYRLRAEHDFEVDDAFDAAPAATGTALALLPSTDLSSLLDSPTSLSALLGDTPPAPRPAPPPPAAAEPQQMEGWDSLLARNEEGELKSNAHNLDMVIGNDLRLLGVPAINEFTQEIVLKRTPRKMRRKERASAHPVRNLEGRLWELKDQLNGDPWIDSHDTSIRIMLEAPTTQGGYGIKISDRDLKAAVDAAAQRNAFHPVRAKLESFIHDGTPRAERLFIDYLGAPDTPYHREAALMFLVGAVARVYEPGHKFDFVPIFEGAQGKGKSTFIRVLGLDWAGELAGEIGDVKTMVEVMQGSWIMEIGELSAMHKSEVNELKAFVSRTADKTRLAYAKRAMVYPRQCVFAGSTNDDTYLRDQTGGRRFWPIKCNIPGEIDNERLRGEIHQIWAEVLAIYRAMRAGHPYGDLPLYLRDQLSVTEAEAMQESRRVETSDDVLTGQIEAWLATPLTDGTGFDDLDTNAPKVYRQETCTAEIWLDLMGGRMGQIDNPTTQKIGRSLRKLGWEPTRNKVGEYAINQRFGRIRVYLKPDHPDR